MAGARLADLQRFASTRPSRRSFRGIVVRELARVVADDERIVEMAASRAGLGCTVVLVTDRRVVIGRQLGSAERVTVDEIALDQLRAATSTGSDGCSLHLATDAGSIELHRFAREEVADVIRAVQSHRSVTRRDARQRPSRRAMNHLEMLDALLTSGILTDGEHQTLRDRWFAQLASRSVD